MPTNVDLNINAVTSRFKQGTADARNELRSLERRSQDANTQMRGQFDKTGGVITGLQNRLIALFSVAMLAGFVRKMIEVRSEFEKYNAVLKNTLGSQTAATKEMAMLQEFAAKTPYSLRELTGAYVKLINYGIKPTSDELRKLGDLASALGKGFDQLVEAIADATTGEFERLKEFGIRASKMGDQVTFSFKEVKTQVDFTKDAITNYILSLGDLEGVSGGMAAISETLGGKISNLGDAWDALLNTMGKKSQGIFKQAIALMTEMIGNVEALMREFDPIYEANKRFDEFKKTLEGLDRETRASKIVDYMIILKNSTVGYKKEIDDLSDKIRDHNLWINRLSKDELINTQTRRTAFMQMASQNEALLVLMDGYLNATWAETDAKKDGDDVTVKVIKNIAWYEEELKKLLKSQKTQTGFELASTNAKIEAYQKQKKALEDLGKTIKELKIKPFKLEEIKIDETGIFSEMFKTDAEKTKEIIDELNAYIIAEAAARDRSYLGNLILTEDQKRDIYQETFNIANQFANAFMNLSQARMESELMAAEGNEEKMQAIRRKYARKQQNIAVLQTIINGAEAIIKLSSQLGILAPPFQAAQGILTAIQIAAIKAQRFATGTLDLKGRGTGTSDSIHAMLSKGESVMTAKETDQYYPYLKAMKEGSFYRFQEELAGKMAAQMITNNNLNYDNSKEIKELREINKNLSREKPEIIFLNGKKIIKYRNTTIYVN